MFIKIVAVAVFCCAATSARTFEEFWLPLTFDQLLTGKNCTQPGYICEDCRSNSFCIQLPNGEFIKDGPVPCRSDETCAEATGQCSTEPNPECDLNVSGYKFVCYQTGIFPDAFDCKTYHMCLPLANGTVDPESLALKCRDGYGFDPKTALCRNVLFNNQCPPMIPPCTSAFVGGPIVANPRLYHLCLSAIVEEQLVYFPQILQCPLNHTYIAGSCIDPNLPANIENGKCTKAGIFYVPDCTKFNACNSTMADPVLYACPVGNKFDPTTLKCEPFEC